METLPGGIHRFLSHVNLSDEVTIAYGDGMARISWGTHELSTRLLDGRYPDYERLFPPSFERKVTFNKQMAINAIERVTSLNLKGETVILNIAPNTIAFFLEDKVSSELAVETIDATLDGEAIEMCLNPRYLLEVMKHQKGETIFFRCNTPVSPVVITGDCPQGTIEQISLLMPIKMKE